MQLRTDIGFGKRIRGCWLDTALELSARGVPFADCKGALAKEIGADNSGAEAIQKIQTSLRRVWFTPPDAALPLRDEALALFKRDQSISSRAVLNWGMVIVSYPFLGDVAEALGRLLRLQGSARRADIERRIREQRGDRDFIGRIVRYNISSFVDWQVIKETATKGIYAVPKQIVPPGSEHIRWLLEAVITSRGSGQLPFAQLRSHPILFPFKLESVTSSVMHGASRLTIQRQSLSDEMVILATEH